jgi:hypothetical protein
MKNLHFMGHRIVASEFLIPMVYFSPALNVIGQVTHMIVIFIVCGGGGGMFVHVCLSHVQVRTGEQDLNITCEPAAILSQNFV